MSNEPGERQECEGNKGLKRRERRRDTRYDLQGEANFRWVDCDQGMRTGKGITKNLCRSGALIETDTVPPLDAQVEVTVALTGDAGSLVKTRLAGTGKVCRIEGSGCQPAGFGAKVSFSTEGTGHLS